MAAVLGTLRRLGLEELISPVGSKARDVAVTMPCAQVIASDSKLAIARGLRKETASSSLGEVPSLSSCDEDDCYEAMDWLFSRQEAIEDALARRHLEGGTLVAYDVSSAAFEGRTCPLGALGHPKDGVRGGSRSSTGCSAPKTGPGCDRGLLGQHRRPQDRRLPSEEDP